MAIKLRVAHVLLLFVASCSQHKQKATDNKAILSCMAAEPSNDEYLQITKCAPLGPQVKWRGTWFTGFEISAFARGYAEIPARIPSPTQLPAYSLVVPKALYERANANNPAGPTAYQITFVGRLLLRPESQDMKTIVLDRIVSIHRVPISPILPTPQRH
jgi:hypothetical protein